MAKNAHNHVKDYTWDKYIDWTFEELKKVLNKKKIKNGKIEVYYALESLFYFSSCVLSLLSNALLRAYCRSQRTLL